MMKMRMVDRMWHFTGGLWFEHAGWRNIPNATLKVSRCFSTSNESSRLATRYHSEHGKRWNGDYHFGMIQSDHNISR